MGKKEKRGEGKETRSLFFSPKLQRVGKAEKNDSLPCQKKKKRNFVAEGSILPAALPSARRMRKGKSLVSSWGSRGGTGKGGEEGGWPNRTTKKKVPCLWGKIEEGGGGGGKETKEESERQSGLKISRGEKRDKGKKKKALDKEKGKEEVSI